jgi:thymidylate kinase
MTSRPVSAAPPCTPGALVVSVIASLEAAGLATVYLRNYERLPHEVGNDVDLLVPAGKRRVCAYLIREAAKPFGWRLLHTVRFGPLAVYLANLHTGETLRFDLFDRIEWHFIEFADATTLIKRRRWNGTVHIPSVQDEIFLNLTTRLIYHGKIRDKHRLQVAENLPDLGMANLGEAFNNHLGESGVALLNSLFKADWTPGGSQKSMARRAALLRHGAKRPLALLVGIRRYLYRSLAKVLNPPGRFIVFEGADGVGKSTVLAQVTPWCAEWCAGREPYRFHWKPGIRVAADATPPAMTTDPRGNCPRSLPASLLFLAYHVLCFWWGWLSRVYPAKAQCRAVVGDRYSYDLYLDPRRFRLNLPPAICRLAVALCPKPDLAIGLVADPAIIRARKPELSAEDISLYQQRWADIASGSRRFITVHADGTPAEVISAIKTEILDYLLSDG